MEKFIVGLTGASGSIYGIRLIEELSKRNYMVHVVATDTAKKVIHYETGIHIEKWIEDRNNKNIILEDINDFFSPVASGSFKTSGMIIMPCSMGTLAKISLGISHNLLDRAADVCLKEKRPLIIVPREAPLSSIHLENMLTLSKVGAMIIPASPGFYSKPKTIDDIIDFMVGKVFDALNIDNTLFKKWRS